MKEQDIIEIKDLLSEPKKIVIVPHKNPDGDAIGSCLGLYHFLTKLNHQPLIIAPNDYPEFLKWMPNETDILKYEGHTESCDKIISEADIVFTLDFNAFHRAGQMEAILESSSAVKIMIDHHQQPDPYAKYMYSDVTMSSTCEMVYHFIDMLDQTELIDKNIASCLYTGIMTDTGSFRFPSTSSTTMRITANLLDKGANGSDIHNAVYDNNSESRFQLLGCALRNMVVLPEYKTAYITLSQEELNNNNFKKGDTEGFVNYGLSLKGICFAVIFIESQKEGIIKVSLRSKGDFSVNEFSRMHFNGGGHTNAAGGRSTENMKSTIEYFISILPSYKNALNS
ncbi:MAG: DHH family phosphoesterase [Bacteroidetes bacterium MedPE-SWsnd-G2]|nr:MAG: DHH family phosphoesterase [Bacteroidetes bacterium MedPE-SWsnd-G2]